MRNLTQSTLTQVLVDMTISAYNIQCSVIICDKIEVVCYIQNVHLELSEGLQRLEYFQPLIAHLHHSSLRFEPETTGSYGRVSVEVTISARDQTLIIREQKVDRTREYFKHMFVHCSTTVFP